MKVKLIKTNEEFMLNPSMEGFKLSLENCQAIERGYDLDELIDIYAEDWKFDERIGFRAGFQKALELMGDKKFSEEDMMNIYILGGKYKTQKPESFLDKGNEIIQSLQQTEWDVEIVMEPCFYDDSLGGFSTSYKEGMPIEQPKRDGDGCLILKRI